MVEDAPFRSASGHCSHLACARFLAGDAAVVSSGSADRAVMRWSLVAADPADGFRPKPRVMSHAAWRSNGRGQTANPGYD